MRVCTSPGGGGVQAKGDAETVGQWLIDSETFRQLKGDFYQAQHEWKSGDKAAANVDDRLKQKWIEKADKCDEERQKLIVDIDRCECCANTFLLAYQTTGAWDAELDRDIDSARGERSEMWYIEKHGVDEDDIDMGKWHKRGEELNKARLHTSRMHHEWMRRGDVEESIEIMSRNEYIDAADECQRKHDELIEDIGKEKHAMKIADVCRALDVSWLGICGKGIRIRQEQEELDKPGPGEEEISSNDTSENDVERQRCVQEEEQRANEEKQTQSLHHCEFPAPLNEVGVNEKHCQKDEQIKKVEKAEKEKDRRLEEEKKAAAAEEAEKEKDRMLEEEEKAAAAEERQQKQDDARRLEEDKAVLTRSWNVKHGSRPRSAGSAQSGSTNAQMEEELRPRAEEPR